MANTKSAKKKVRVDSKRTQVNFASRIAAKKAVKAFYDSVKEGSDSSEALKKAQKRVDIAAKNNVYHKNKASRIKSKMANELKK